MKYLKQIKTKVEKLKMPNLNNWIMSLKNNDEFSNEELENLESAEEVEEPTEEEKESYLSIIINARIHDEKIR
jgi:hypothetical protein